MTSTRSLVVASAWLTLQMTAVAVCAAQTANALVVSSDPELAAIATRLLPDLAKRAGMELHEPVRLELRSREQLVRYLQHKLDEELPPDEARARTDAYALMGLAPADLDLRGVLLDLYTEQVAGFYEPDSTALFVMDDQPDDALEALLVHELVHAVQDQTAQLDSIVDPELGHDRATAAQSAVEGHATLVMLEYMTEQMSGTPVDIAQVPDFSRQVRPALQALTSQFPALASAPRVLRESLLFPYVDGASFVQHLWTGGERRSPFGSALPLSTEQILHPGAAPPLELDVSVEGGTVVLGDVLGALELIVMLEDVVGVPGGDEPGQGPSGEIAAGWDGDRYAVVELPDGQRALAWFAVWESEGARDRFADAVENSHARFGGPVSIERTTIDGKPATHLTVGPGGFEATAHLRGGGR